MIQSPKKNLTLEEFLKLPETKPASEYINGQIIQKLMPQGKHSIIQGELVSTINAIVKIKRIAIAFPELRCNFAGRSIVPDVTVFTWAKIPLDENGDIGNVFNSYPDWTIEILSPEQNQNKVTEKILHCLNNGSQLGWLIDPRDRSVLIYPSGKQPQLLREKPEVLLVPDFASELQITVGQLFGWLKL
jgi:Uma2 family endonuclease